MKKKNNPFKMWGSWIGVVIGIVGGYIDGCFGGFCDTLVFMSDLTENFSVGFNNLFNFLIFIISGFLIGWGLTLLWRKIK